LPIVDEKGHLTGIVSLDDLTRLLGRELFNLAEGVRHEVEVKQRDPGLDRGPLAALVEGK
jgi:hypothetical protein